MIQMISRMQDVPLFHLPQSYLLARKEYRDYVFRCHLDIHRRYGMNYHPECFKMELKDQRAEPYVTLPELMWWKSKERHYPHFTNEEYKQWWITSKDQWIESLPPYDEEYLHTIVYHPDRLPLIHWANTMLLHIENAEAYLAANKDIPPWCQYCMLPFE